MKAFGRTASSVFFWLIVAGCSKFSSKVEHQIVARVGTEQLSAKQFADSLLSRLKHTDPVFLGNPKYQKEIKDQVIEEFYFSSFVKIYAANNSIQIADDEVTEAVNKTKQQYPDEIAFKQTIIENGMTESEWRKVIRQNLLNKKVLNHIERDLKPPSENEMLDYFNLNKDKFKAPDMILLAQIVVDTEPAAQALLEDLKKATLTFESAALKYSIAPESKAKGVVGWVERGTVEVFEKAFELPLEALSSVIKSEYGWHIFKVLQKKAATEGKFDDVRQRIELELMEKRKQSKFADWLDRQIRESSVFQDDALIEKISVEPRGK